LKTVDRNCHEVFNLYATIRICFDGKAAGRKTLIFSLPTT
jgi:hypothetical protein